MKKRLLLMLCLAFGAMQAQAQEDSTFDKILRDLDEPKDVPAVSSFDSSLLGGRTIVKMNLTGIALRNYSFSVEQVLGKRLSVQLGGSIMPTGSFPFAKEIDKRIPELAGSTISSKMITPELRIYLGKGYGQGFYIAPYLRYESYQVAGMHYTTMVTTTIGGVSVSKEAKLDLNGNLNSLGAGLLLGAQWQFGSKKNFVIDWSIIGGHLGQAKVNLNGKISGLPAGIEPSDEDIANLRQQIDKSIDKLPFKPTERDIVITKKDGKLSGKMPFGFVRMAVSFGVRF